jgi:hypothetical protein
MKRDTWHLKREMRRMKRDISRMKRELRRVKRKMRQMKREKRHPKQEIRQFKRSGNPMILRSFLPAAGMTAHGHCMMLRLSLSNGSENIAQNSAATP